MNCRKFCMLSKRRKSVPSEVGLKIKYARSAFFCFNEQHMIFYRNYFSDSH